MKDYCLNSLTLLKNLVYYNAPSFLSVMSVMSVTFCYNRVIPFVLVMPDGSIFVMTMAECSQLFMKLGEQKTISLKKQSRTNNWKKRNMKTTGKFSTQ